MTEMRFDETPSWECSEFFQEMNREDRKRLINEHIREMKRMGYSKTQIQAELIQLNFAPGLVTHRILES